MVTKDHVIHLLDATKLLDHKNNQEEGIANAQLIDEGSQVDNIAEQVQRKVSEQQQLIQQQLWKRRLPSNAKNQHRNYQDQLHHHHHHHGGIRTRA